MRRRRRPPAKRLPDELAAAVHALDGGRCVVCGKSVDWRVNPAHHAWPKARWPELRLDPRNLVTICLQPCHARHESAFRRIPASALPGRVFDLAYALDDRARAYLQRTYPPDVAPPDALLSS